MPPEGPESEATESPVKPGDVLARKYRIDRILGVGGMGVVVAARHIQLDEYVALKFLLPEALQNRQVVARFAREARAAVKIRSEHVARVIDVGELETGAPYMVMEYLEGADLAALSHQTERGQFPVKDAIDYVLQALEAVAEAHTLGIIHRDLKPANLFLTHRADGSPSIKVLDFGISKVTGVAAGSMGDAGLTKTSTSMGSPLYMSPEQMSSSRDVDVRTDIWAMGVILYELLNGIPPFRGETMPQLCASVLQEEPRSLTEVRSDVPPALEAIIHRCLKKDPAHRFSNVAEFALALQDFGSRDAVVSVERVTRLYEASGMSISQIQAGALPTAPVPGASIPDRTGVAWGQSAPTKPSWKMPVLAVTGVAGVLAVIATIAVVALRSGPNDPEPAADPAVTASGEEIEPAVSTEPPRVEVEPPPPVASSAPADSALPKPPPKPTRVTTPRPPRTAKPKPPPKPTKPPPTSTKPSVPDYGDRH